METFMTSPNPEDSVDLTPVIATHRNLRKPTNPCKHENVVSKLSGLHSLSFFVETESKSKERKLS